MQNWWFGSPFERSGAGGRRQILANRRPAVRPPSRQPWRHQRSPIFHSCTTTICVDVCSAGQEAAQKHSRV
eukprot:358645-Chlamydomonas_euryale.AAC.18